MGDYFDGYYYRHNENTKRRLSYKEAGTAVFLIILCFALCLLVVFFGISQIFAYNERIVIAEERRYFAVMTGSYQDVDKARNMAVEVSAKGGAGYIWNDGQFSVLISVHGEFSDALNVAFNNGCEVYEIVFPQVELDFSTSAAGIEALKNSVDTFYSLCDSLIQLAREGHTDYSDLTSGLNLLSLYAGLVGSIDFGRDFLDLEKCLTDTVAKVNGLMLTENSSQSTFYILGELIHEFWTCLYSVKNNSLQTI